MNVVFLMVFVLGIPVSEPVLIKARSCTELFIEMESAGIEIKPGYTLVCSEGNWI